MHPATPPQHHPYIHNDREVGSMKPNRETLMAALMAGAHIVSVSPVLPVHVKADDDGTLNLYFHRDVAAVEAFAIVFGAEVSARSHTGEPGSDVYTSAEGECLAGVRFHAWTLTPPPVTVCHDAELAAGHASEAHELDDDSVFAVLAPGYAGAVSA